MSSDLVNHGLMYYASGDLEAAARAWIQARLLAPTDRQISSYLHHLRSLAPDVVERIERELAAKPVAPPPAPPAAPPPPPAELAAPAPPPPAFLATKPVPAPGSAPLVIRGAPPPARYNRPPPQRRHSDPWGGDAHLGPAVTVSSSGPGLAIAGSPKAPDAPAPATGQDLEGLQGRLRDLNELDDFSGMLAVSQQILAVDPTNARALTAQARSREMLTKMYASEIGDMGGVPTVLVPPDQVIWLDLDHRAGFVLSQVDGSSTYNDIVAITGMAELESLAILAKLVREKVIGTP